MISRARPLCVLMNAISSSSSCRQVRLALEQLRRAEYRLQRVVQLVRDAGHQDADGSEPFLAHDLTLQRLERLAHLALLLDAMVERAVRVAQARRHRRERGVELVELAVGQPGRRGRRQIAVGDALHGEPDPVDATRQRLGQPQRQQDDRREGEVRGCTSCADRSAPRDRPPRWSGCRRSTATDRDRARRCRRTARRRRGHEGSGRAARRAAPTDRPRRLSRCSAPASRLRASTRPAASNRVTTEPSGSGTSLNSVCRLADVEPERQDADDRVGVFRTG